MASQNLFIENFLGKQFSKMPSGVRALVYVMFALVAVHNGLKGTIIRGQLWLKTPAGTATPAEGYVISAGSDTFVVNKTGWWVLSPGRVIPGSIRATLGTPTGSEKIADFTIPMPWPILGPLLNDPVSVTYDPAHNSATVVAGNLPSLVDTLLAADLQQAPPSGKTDDPFYVGIKRLIIREAGDIGGRADLFFKVFIDGKEYDPLGFPSRKYRGTHLLIGNNTTTDFKDLGFTIQRAGRDASPVNVQLYLYDWDPCIFCINNPDDLVGLFKFAITSADVGHEMVIKTERDIDPDRRYPVDNSSILVSTTVNRSGAQGIR